MGFKNIEQSIIKILQDQTSIKSINLEKDFNDLGMDSLDIIQFCSEVEENFGIDLDNLNNNCPVERGKYIPLYMWLTPRKVIDYVSSQVNHTS
ncbi:hypothetical protein CMI39_02975 [Candidatus Pacearchaeota archaeon]|jgi:acyl carrier protein|nr:hypothetical protein [Candidatus Pacearchaeota archaeon]|tara:strand:- start:410 stop:688 length:279 start_codon:yes stop_codon:yes gene_type:complete